MRKRPCFPALVALSGIVALLAGCEPDQLLVFVDTDAPAASQINEQEQIFQQRNWLGALGLSPDAMVDTVRVDILGPRGEPEDACEFLVFSKQNWPLSFGVPKSDHIQFLRIRAFQRTFTLPADAHGFRNVCGKPVTDDAVAVLSEPPHEVTIDRVMAVPPSIHGVRRIALTLSLSCMGEPSSFLSQRTCIGGDHLPPTDAAFDDESQWQEVQDAPPTKAGTSFWAQDRTCTAPKPTSVPENSIVCVPGGFFIQGDLRFQDEKTALNPKPLRAVYSPPMYWDKTELSVGALKAIRGRAMGQGISLGEPYVGTDYEDCTMADCPGVERFNCTWKLPGHGDDRLPVNCVRFPLASAVCEFQGGALPSESQWEHAARGRGRRWSFAWGTVRPDAALPFRCCHSSMGRSVWLNNTDPPPELGVPERRCDEIGPAPVGSYTNDTCPDGGDVSIDGIFDLSGNVAEYVQDSLRTYTNRCGLEGGVTLDPRCLLQTSPARYQRRGGSFFVGDAAIGHGAQRAQVYGGFAPDGSPLDAAEMETGFRCVYKGERP